MYAIVNIVENAVYLTFIAVSRNKMIAIAVIAAQRKIVLLGTMP